MGMEYIRVSGYQAELEEVLPKGRGKGFAYWDSYAREVVEIPERGD